MRIGGTNISWQKAALLFILCFTLALINLHLKLIKTPSWFNGNLVLMHKLLMLFWYTNNEQSRILQFFIPEFFIRSLDVSIITAYVIQRLLFTTITIYLFFYFSLKWLSQRQAALCIILYACIMPFTYKDHLQESAALMSLTFLIALWMIRERKDYWFMLVLAIGGMNNETTLFLPAAYFFYRYKDKKSIIPLGIRTVLLAVPAYAVVGIIRYINRNQPHLGGAWHLPDNLANLDKLFMIYHLFWILPFFFFKKKDQFIQRMLLVMPLFIIPHLITGVIKETRQMLPLAFVIIPASILTIIEWRKRHKTELK